MACRPWDNSDSFIQIVHVSGVCVCVWGGGGGGGGGTRSCDCAVIPYDVISLTLSPWKVEERGRYS